MSESSTWESTERAENRARAAAELVLGSELLPGPVPLPDFALLMSERKRWRRIGLALSSVGALGAVALAAAMSLRESEPVSYVVHGTVAIAEGVIDAAGTPGTAPAALRFSEGTEVGLMPGARLRVVERTAAGASLALDRGRARFAVTHREDARWSVATGPFTVEVTGTRFSLDWSPRDERLVVELTSGSVQVRGASVGGPVAMHAGERLIATAADRRVTLSPLAEAPASAPTAVVAERTRLAVLEEAPHVVAEPAQVQVNRPSRRGSRRSRLALATPTHVTAPVRASTSPSSSTLPAAAPIAAVAPVVTPVEARRAPEPPPVAPMRPEPVAPALAAPVVLNPGLGLGGSACGVGAQYRFERPESGILLPDFYTLAFSSPRPDRSHSWCGLGSLRLDATFNDAGRRNFFGRFPKETGQVVLKLHRRTDFTGRTVTVHFYVDGPTDARFTAELVVVNQGRWVSGPPSRALTPGHWWTISHRFEAENQAGGAASSNPGPFPVGGTSPVSDVDRLGIAIHSTGGRRVWTGAVYVDDVGWK